MFDYKKDRWSYPVTMVIFMAAVNPYTTTTFHTPAEKLHDTLDQQGNFFFSILGTLTICLGTTIMDQERWPSATSLYGKEQVLYRLSAKWPPPMSKETSI